MTHSSINGTLRASRLVITESQLGPARIFAYCITMVSSLIGNSLVLAIVYKNANQRMRTACSSFIVNMACADILITVISVPRNIMAEKGWSVGGAAGDTLCRVFFFFWLISLSVSVQSLILIAVDRLFLVFFPLKRVITHRRSRLLIVITWIAAAFVSFPFLLFTKMMETLSGTFHCVYTGSSLLMPRVYILCLSFVLIVPPLLAVLGIYTAVGVKLYLTNTPGNPLPESQRRNDARNRRVVRMFATIVSVFALCWLPLLSIFTVCYTADFEKIPDLCFDNDILFTIFYLPYTNSALNPVIYFLFNKDYRQGAWSILCRCTITNEIVAPSPARRTTAGQEDDLNAIQSLPCQEPSQNVLSNETPEKKEQNLDKETLTQSSVRRATAREAANPNTTSTRPNQERKQYKPRNEIQRSKKHIRPHP